MCARCASNGVENCFCAPMFVGITEEYWQRSGKTHSENVISVHASTNMPSCVRDNIQPPWCWALWGIEEWGVDGEAPGWKWEISLACAMWRCTHLVTLLLCGVQLVCTRSRPSKLHAQQRAPISSHTEYGLFCSPAVLFLTRLIERNYCRGKLSGMCEINLDWRWYTRRG